ncbi:MAG: hypothetical protein JNL11_02110 [Bdellovibrionaceae bacterium]|nr:hypothetical protein [Pseudobdellovibrionaceae bacterium]
MDALSSLQNEIDQGRFNQLSSQNCALAKNYKLIFDTPAGQSRYSYAKIISNKVLALSIFAMAQPISGLVCFNIGYAVSRSSRGQNLGVEAVSIGISELEVGLKRNNLKEFYIEAVVEETNYYSIVVANKIFGNTGNKIVDASSGKPAFAFQKIINIR